MARELINELRTGDLVALFYKTRAEQFKFVVPYIAAGLASNQRCLYIADDTPVALIFKKLEAAGIDVEAARRRGALDVLTKHETYLRNGNFEAEKMISDLELDAYATIAKGFSGLRGSGDMSWALDNVSNLAKMIEYQEKLFQRFPPNFLAMCQYDETRFPSDVLKRMAQVHSVIIHDGVTTRVTQPRSITT
jgi:hypothetical protein